jgi:hypothetical protein
LHYYRSAAIRINEKVAVAREEKAVMTKLLLSFPADIAAQDEE